MNARACSLVVVGLLTASAAAATEGRLPHDTFACKNKSTILGLSDAMRRTDGPGFNAHIYNLKATGECANVEGGRVLTFTKTEDGACLSLKLGEPCYWTPTTPQSSPETTGQSSGR